MPNPSLYDDDSGGEQQAAAPDSGGKEEQSESQTFLIPKSALAGHDLKPGDKCDFEVVRVHEDAYEAQGCEGGGEQEQEAPAEAPAPETGGNPMME